MTQFAINLPVIDAFPLVDCRRREKHHQVMARVGRFFGRSLFTEFFDWDLVYYNFHVMLLAPTSGEDLVKPFIVARDKMFPLQDSYSFLSRLCAFRIEIKMPRTYF